MEDEELTQEEKSIILMQWLKTHCMGCEIKLTKTIHTKNSGYCDECRTEQIKWEQDNNF